MGDALGLAVGGQLHEGGRLHPTSHGQMVGGGPQILADGDDVDPNGGQVVQRLAQLVVGLAHPHDDGALGDQPRFLGCGQHPQGAGVGSGRAGGPLQAGHRFNVVVGHVGPGLEDDRQGGRITFAVGKENLHGATRGQGPDGGDGGGEPAGSTVGQIVAGHRRHYREAQAHGGHGLGHPGRLAQIEGKGLGGVHQTEATGPGATLPVDHEGGGAIGPTFRKVWAARLLTNGDQIQAAHQLAQLQHRLIVAHPGSQPLRLRTGDGQTLAHPGLGQAALQPNRLPRPQPSTKGGQIGRAMPPDHVGSINEGAIRGGQRRRVSSRSGRGGLAPALTGPDHHRVDYLAHAHANAFRGQGGHLPVGQPAGHDAAESVQHLIGDVEGEAVHAAPPGQPHPDGGDLLGRRPSHRRHPYPRVCRVVETAGQAEIGQRLDQHLGHSRHIPGGIGHTPAAVSSHVEDGITDQLAGTVVGDIATPVGPHQLRPQLVGRAAQVGQVGSHPQRVHRFVLQQQQIIGARPPEQPALQGESVAVANPTQPTGAQHQATSTAQSRVSRIWRSRSRKAAA